MVRCGGRPSWGEWVCLPACVFVVGRMTQYGALAIAARCIGHRSALRRALQRLAFDGRSGCGVGLRGFPGDVWCVCPLPLGLLHRPPCRCSLLRLAWKRECASTLLCVSWRTRGTWSIPAGAGQKGWTGVSRCRGGGPGVPLRVPYCLSSRITQLSYSPLRLISIPRFMRNLPVKV